MMKLVSSRNALVAVLLTTISVNCLPAVAALCEQHDDEQIFSPIKHTCTH